MYGEFLLCWERRNSVGDDESVDEKVECTRGEFSIFNDFYRPVR